MCPLGARAVLQGSLKDPQILQQCCPPEVQQLIHGLINVDPAARWSNAQIRAHPWVAEGEREAAGAAWLPMAPAPATLEQLAWPELEELVTSSSLGSMMDDDAIGMLDDCHIEYEPAGEGPAAGATPRPGMQDGSWCSAMGMGLDALGPSVP